MRRGILALVIVLSGCANVNSLRQHPADLEVESSKSPSEFGQCIQTGWGEFYGVTANGGSTPNGGYTVNRPNPYTGNDGVVDITPISMGSKAVAKYRMSSLGGHEKFDEVIRKCR